MNNSVTKTGLTFPSNIPATLFIIACIISVSLLYLIKSKLIASISAYEADTGFGIFIFACLLSLFMGMTAVIYHTIKASRANPVDALRYE